MSYQVLARRWRPKTFAQLVGQEHVVRALSNALDNDRLHHAYLFTGTRGVGKTTIARILAKSLNCEQGVSAHPCGECSVCREVDEGRFVDLIEVDAASKTGVDDTRELLENVPYAPVRGRYKVYLIDEVHMFSGHSFNALLKTLEEPPPHVKFLLATTDPQKVPVTVLSRCLQFSLNRLPIEQISDQFDHILQAEGIEADAEALSLLARAADGSMRDGLSLLDQAIAFGGGAVGLEATRDMLGVTASDQLPLLLQQIQQGDAAAVLEGVAALSQQTPDFAALLKDMLLLLHRVALLQATPTAWQSSWGDKAAYEALSAALAAEDVQLYYQIALVGQRDLPLAPDMRSGFEMVLLRMLAFRPGGSDTGTESSVTTARPAAAAPTQAAQPGSDPKAVSAPESRGIAPDAAADMAVDFSNWHALVPRLGLTGMAAQLASHSAVKTWDGNQLSLEVDQNCASMLGSLAEDRLREALEKLAGRPLKLLWQQGAVKDTPAERKQVAKQQREQQAREDIASDPLVQAMQETFDAELIEDSIRPTEH